MDSATRAELKRVFYTGYKVLACFPAAWLLLFLGFVLRAKLFYPDYFLRNDPKELAMPLHHFLTFWGLVLTFWFSPATFLLTVALFFQARWLALSKYVFLFLLSALGFYFLVFTDAFDLVSWFLD
ncbi:MAG: hypothetical protein ACRYFZ_13170 [Janthinobacterium lividum]